MNKLKLPTHPHKGMKIYCHKCKRDNPTCNHFEIQRFKNKVWMELLERSKIVVDT